MAIPPSLPSVARLPSDRLARVGLFLAELLLKLQSSTHRFAHTSLCWQTLGGHALVEPCWRPIFCHICVWPMVTCFPPKMSAGCNRISCYLMLSTAHRPFCGTGANRSKGVIIWFVVAWILKVSVRQMAYFWFGSTGDLIRDQLGLTSPWFELRG